MIDQILLNAIHVRAPTCWQGSKPAKVEVVANTVYIARYVCIFAFQYLSTSETGEHDILFAALLLVSAAIFMRFICERIHRRKAVSIIRSH